MDEAKKLALSRIGEKASSSSSSSSGGHGGDGGGEKPVDDKDVTILTEGSFSEVINSKDIWLVEFYAPWCGHCKKLAPEWAECGTKLKGEIRVGKVDCTAEQSICSSYGVGGYPTIKLFVPGKDPVPFEGSRDASSIMNWALEQKQSLKPPMEVKQLTN